MADLPLVDAQAVLGLGGGEEVELAGQLVQLQPFAPAAERIRLAALTVAASLSTGARAPVTTVCQSATRQAATPCYAVRI